MEDKKASLTHKVGIPPLKVRRENVFENAARPLKVIRPSPSLSGRFPTLRFCLFWRRRRAIASSICRGGRPTAKHRKL